MIFKCPRCDNDLNRVNPGELTFSHSEETNALGWTKDCWYAEWKCECGVFAQEWFDDDPPTDYGYGAARTGEWSYYVSSDEWSAFRDRYGVLTIEDDSEPEINENDGRPVENDPDDRHHQRQQTCPHCHLPVMDCECGDGE